MGVTWVSRAKRRQPQAPAFGRHRALALGAAPPGTLSSPPPITALHLHPFFLQIGRNGAWALVEEREPKGDNDRQSSSKSHVALAASSSGCRPNSTAASMAAPHESHSQAPHKSHSL